MSVRSRLRLGWILAAGYILAAGLDEKATELLENDDQDAQWDADQLASVGAGQIVRFASSPRESRLDTGVLPIVLMHGMGDFSSNPSGMEAIRHAIETLTGSYVRSVAICADGRSNCPKEDQRNSYFMPMNDQVDVLTNAIKSDPELAGGFNAIGFSQGALLFRGYIERYNDPPLKSLISMHGVMMGVAGLPRCPRTTMPWTFLCQAVGALIRLGVHVPYVQARLAQANYFRTPTAISRYQRSVRFLPDINNEDGTVNETYRSNFESLEKLILVQADSDTMIIPKESQHFGYFEDGSVTSIMEMRDSPWYMENWFGLQTLDMEGKLSFYNTPGDHLNFTMEFLGGLIENNFM